MTWARIWRPNFNTDSRQLMQCAILSAREVSVRFRSLAEFNEFQVFPSVAEKIDIPSTRGSSDNGNFRQGPTNHFTSAECDGCGEKAVFATVASHVRKESPNSACIVVWSSVEHKAFKTGWCNQLLDRFCCCCAGCFMSFRCCGEVQTVTCREKGSMTVFHNPLSGEEDSPHTRSHHAMTRLSSATRLIEEMIREAFEEIIFKDIHTLSQDVLI